MTGSGALSIEEHCRGPRASVPCRLSGTQTCRPHHRHRLRSVLHRPCQGETRPQQSLLYIHNFKRVRKGDVIQAAGIVPFRMKPAGWRWWKERRTIERNGLADNADKGRGDRICKGPARSKKLAIRRDRHAHKATHTAYRDLRRANSMWRPSKCRQNCTNYFRSRRRCRLQSIQQKIRS